MAEIVRMPKLSDTMTEGVVAKWHKKVGDTVKSGELLAEIETDKATMEFESFEDGVLLHQGVSEGGTAPVDSVLAILGKKGEKFEHLLKEESNGSSSSDDKTEGKEETKSEEPKKETKKIDTSDINAKIVRMPKLSDTMTDGVVAKWHKKVGDKVSSGELLAEIETDKATMEFESFEDGTLLYVGVENGGTAPVDSILAIIGEKGADYQKLIEAEEQYSTSVEETPKEEKSQSIAESALKAETPKSQAIVSKPATSSSSNGRIIASPLAKSLAKEKGISLSLVQGTGEGGRIVKRDVENYAPGLGGIAALASESYTEEPVSQMRKTIARRLGESKFSAPHFYLTMEINMDGMIDARKQINLVSPVKISFNDIVIKAVSHALTKHPKVNSSWLGDKIRFNKHVNIGVAVAVEEGLLVPVVKFANTKRLSQIADEVKVFAEKAKNKQLQPSDWEGNTFTISNLGMFGIEEFTAIINPPDACILAVGGIKQTPVVREGQIVPGNVMKVTLSCDHRVVDGATGSAFLQTLKKYMEFPVMLFGEGVI